jgi:hypothetical protein
MKLEGIKAQVGYRKHKGHFSGKPAVVADNVLDRKFTVATPNRYWVTTLPTSELINCCRFRLKLSRCCWLVDEFSHGI